MEFLSFLFGTITIGLGIILLLLITLVVVDLMMPLKPRRLELHPEHPGVTVLVMAIPPGPISLVLDNRPIDMKFVYKQGSWHLFPDGGEILQPGLPRKLSRCWWELNEPEN